MRSVLLQLHVGGPQSCRSWVNAPVANGVQINVYVENPGGPAEALARLTHDALERELTRFGAIPQPAPCMASMGHIASGVQCAGNVTGLVSRVLIFVANGSGRIDPAIEQYFSARGSVIVPIVDQAISTVPQTVLPPFIATTLAERTTNGDPHPILPRLLRAAGIVASVSLFISYRHADAKVVAGQLFHALAERGFAPFLDRFSSQPGDDFLELIQEELADKACLVSLETSDIGQSLYCRQEVAVAVARRMGMIAVDLPGSVGTFPAIANRINATGYGRRADGGLADADVQQIAGDIEQLYPHEAVRRPRWQDDTLAHAVMAAHLPLTSDGLGRYVVSGPSNRHLLAMSPLLPGAGLFIDVEERRTALSVRDALIFGPLTAARTNRHRQIHWLSTKSGIDAHDEGNLMRSVATLS